MFSGDWTPPCGSCCTKKYASLVQIPWRVFCKKGCNADGDTWDECAITMDVFLNSNWEEDFPPDPSGKFKDFEQFVRSNFEICEWVGLSVVAAQVLSIILGIVLRTLGPDRETDYDSDDDAIVPARLPLLRNQAQHGSDYAEPNTSRRSDSWKLRILDKVHN